MKERSKYNDQQWAFLECLFGPEARGDSRRAMTIAGYSENTSVNSVLSTLREEISELTQLHIATNGPKAVFATLGVLSNPNEAGNKNLLAAAKDILDRGGYSKSTTEVNVRVPEGGLVILPMKNKRVIDDPSTGATSDENTEAMGTPSQV